jgi:hypothetical protein
VAAGDEWLVRVVRVLDVEPRHHLGKPRLKRV